MDHFIRPVDVISLCSTTGALKPLRVRLEEEEQFIRMDIQEVIHEKEITYVGAEAKIFLCRAMLQERECMVELKYTIRSHTWTLLGKVYG